MTTAVANAMAETLREHAKYGRFGQYNDVALAGAQEIDRLQGLLSQALSALAVPPPLFVPGAPETATRFSRYCAKVWEGVTMVCIRKAGHEGNHQSYPLKGPADRLPRYWREPGEWSDSP